MSDDLVKFKISAEFVLARISLWPPELAYGYNHEWLDDEAVVKIAECEFTRTVENSEVLVDLAILLRSEYDRIPDVFAGIDDELSRASDPASVWLYLALDWLYSHQSEFVEPLELIEMLYADFDYPQEIVGLVRYMPLQVGQPGGPEALRARWRQYLDGKAAEYAARS